MKVDFEKKILTFFFRIYRQKFFRQYMGQCISCKCLRHPKERPAEPTPRINRDLTRFYSFEVDSAGNLVPETPEPEKAMPQRLECVAESTMSEEETAAGFGPRDRIPSHVNIDSFDAEYWWSGANLEKPAIAHDMGLSPAVMSRPIKVSVIPSSFFASHRDSEAFPELVSFRRSSTMTEASPTTTASLSSRCTVRRLLVFKLKMGDKVMVSLNEVSNEEMFDSIFKQENREELLRRKLKLILSPINSPLPIPAKKPRDAETIGSYFGMENVDFYIDESVGSVRIVSILINIYSKWIIRKFMPWITQSKGRMCDFILLSSDDRIVFANFRLLATQVSQSLISG